MYEFVTQLGVGSTGITRLMKDKRTGELVAAKWVPHTAGEMLSVQVEREILNHRRLLHNNVVRFREVRTVPHCQSVNRPSVQQE